MLGLYDKFTEQKILVTARALAQMKMDKHHTGTTNKKRIRNNLLFGLACLLWFIFRTGAKPSRITYPCQRAALANSSLLLSISIPLSLTAVLAKTKKSLSTKGKTLALLTIMAGAIIVGEQFLGNLQLVGAANPYQEVQLTLESRNAATFPASDIFVVNGRESAHISELIDLMGSNGLLFYKSSTSEVNRGPSGLIAADDVVLIKINEEWPYRGGTNTDVLKELIQAIVNHPDGFVGEIVVADNGQWQGSMDWPQSNAEDITQSTQDVVDMFSSRVSTYSWMPIRGRRVDEYSAGDMRDGYILHDTADPDTGIYVSYPKFRTEFGTYVSFKHGVWNGAEYEERLKVINMPVLKSHGGYGVTASLKHYMGVQSQGEGQEGLANGHSAVATGGMGTLMVETGLPTLNIIDAIWINANPPTVSPWNGPGTPYDRATRVNVLLASTDPVALDYWAAKHVLVQAASLIGYTDTHTLDPDNTARSGLTEAFGVWLRLTRDEIAAGGYDVTTDENRMNVYVPTLVGDVNDDGIVDIYDVVTVSLAFGTEPGDDNWNPVADLVQDEVIDIYDVVSIAENFGKKVPTGYAYLRIDSNNPVAPSVPFKVDGSSVNTIDGKEYLDGLWNVYTVVAGTHSIEWPASWTNPTNQITYQFQQWGDGVADNPRTIIFEAGLTITLVAVLTPVI